MTTLVALLSTGKGSWAEVFKLLRSEVFEKAYLVTNTFGKEKCQEQANLVVVDLDQDVIHLRDALITALKEPLRYETEVALNISSGTGAQHTALLSALLKLGVGIRLVIPTEGGVDEV
ncbi:hypothetical protein D6783_00435 [Candidatus Woesearchaeota archaeon]|nr:MAG: hypothetical protein D6783_00435 [Candidatus Woesearchaeota archaeon]